MVVRMVTLYHPKDGVMHVEKERVEHFESLGWSTEPPKKEEPKTAEAPKRRKPRGTEES